MEYVQLSVCQINIADYCVGITKSLDSKPQNKIYNKKKTCRNM